VPSSPTRYLAVVALSAVAFIGQAIGTSTVADTSGAAIVAARTTDFVAQRFNIAPALR
jgi:hypothetical protein